jgi:hypothetical protein
MERLTELSGDQQRRLFVRESEPVSQLVADRSGRYRRKVEAAQSPEVAPDLTKREITRILNRYIGVSGGYLGDFSYSCVCEVARGDAGSAPA